MFSLVYSNMAAASSCSSFTNDVKYHTEYHNLFSICFDGYKRDGTHNDIYAGIKSDYHHSSDDDDDKRYGNKSRHRYKSSRHGDSHHEKSGRHSEHDFDWSDYDLKSHDHDDDEHYHYYGYKDDDHSDDHHDHKYWPKYKDDYEHRYCLPGEGYGDTVVPIPAALWLFVSGLIGLFAVSRKKNK